MSFNLSRMGKSSYIVLVFLVLSLVIQAERANECTKALSPPIRKALQNDLCGPSSPGHTGPAKCATTARKISSSLKIESIAELCRDAESDAPALCIGKFRMGTSIDVMIELCAPLGEDIGGSSKQAIEGPSECYSGAPRGWEDKDIAWLCQDALSEKTSKPLPVECALESMKYNQFRTGSTSSSLVASLCQGSKVKTGPIKCALAVPDALKKIQQQTTKITSPEIGSQTIVSKLCRFAINDWPAKCYNKINNHKFNKFNDDEKVELCQHATSLSPATCVLSSALSKLDSKVRIALCKNNNDKDNNEKGGGGEVSASVAKCAEAAYPMFSRNHHQSDLLVKLCQGSHSGLGPTQCLSKAPLTIDMESRVQLCMGALDDGPAKCFKAIRTLKVTHGTGMRDVDVAIELCQQAQSSAPADCFESSPRELDQLDRILMCKKAINKAPAECAQRGYKTNIPNKALVELCQGLIDIAAPLPDRTKPKYKQYGSNKRKQQQVQVEEEVSYGCPSDCAVAAMRSGLMHGFTNNEEIAKRLIILCQNADVRAVEQCLIREEFVGTGSKGAHLSLSARISLCSGATSEVKARCASAAGKGVSSKDILALCQQATSVTPGACANHVVRHEMKQLSSPIIESCRSAVSKPYNLHIEKMWWDGGELATTDKESSTSNNNNGGEIADTRGYGLFSGRTVHVLLSLTNQFHWPISKCYGCEDENKSIVYATTSIPKSGGGGRGSDSSSNDKAIGDLIGLKTNTSLNGYVEFHALRFSASGEYDLRFHLNRNTQKNNNNDDDFHRHNVFGSNLGGNTDIATQLIRVKVESHEDDGLGPLGQCGRSLYSLLSSSYSSSFSSNNHEDKVVNGISLDEEVALILSSSSLQALSLFPPLTIHQNDKMTNSQSNETSSSSSAPETCASKLSSAGIKLVSGWGGSLYIRYKPVVFALDKGEGLPDNVLDPCERLGLDCGHNAHQNKHHVDNNNEDDDDDDDDSAKEQKRSKHHKNMPSARKVRSAYYRASLLWHPDRWASFSDNFQRAAQDQFELISEAYRSLGGGSNNGNSKNGDDEDGDTTPQASEVLYL